MAIFHTRLTKTLWSLTKGIDRCRKRNTQRAVQGVGFQPDASACFLKFVLVMKG
jgi:hypothetical protein